MNKAILLGRLIRDPECRYTDSGKVVVQFTMAVDRPFSNQDGQKEADFIPVVMWGKSAETLANTVSKGQRILVEGRIQVRSYDGKDGVKRYVTEVIASGFEYIERREQSMNREQGMTKEQAAAKQGKKPSGFKSMGVPFDEEIPF